MHQHTSNKSVSSYESSEILIKTKTYICYNTLLLQCIVNQSGLQKLFITENFHTLEIFIQSRGEQSSDSGGGVTFGKRLLKAVQILIIITLVPPFLNYAALQKEASELKPSHGELQHVICFSFVSILYLYTVNNTVELCYIEQ